MAHVDLGLSDEQFGRLTPRQFRLLEERTAERQEAHDRTEQWIAARILSTIVNYSYLAPKEPREPWSFGLPLVDPPPAKRMTKARRQQVASDMRTWFQRMAKSLPKAKAKE